MSFPYSVPTTFDGEIPEFAFGEAERRFTIGERLEVDGHFMTLQSGIVVEPEQKACLVVTDSEGHSHIVKADLSDAEMAAYRSHPETFFGRVVSVPNELKDPMDLYEFLIDSCKDTPRERLLELMDSAPDIDKLKKLSNDELLYVYAERLTHRAMQNRRDPRGSGVDLDTKANKADLVRYSGR